MHTHCAPVPARPGDLVRSARAGMFHVTESKHHRELALHVHGVWTVTMLLGGAFEERYAGRRRPQTCRRFGVLLRRPGEVHSDQFGAEGAHNLVLELDETALARVGAIALGEDAISGVELELIARRMHDEMQRPDTVQALALEGLGLELIASIARARARPAESDVVRAARAVLADRFREPDLRIGELAESLGAHPVALARAFRASTGTSPSEYVRRLRVEWAASEVARGERPLAEIALSAGFADQSHFTRAFRRAFGVTPARVRRERR